nr:MAG TPA: hypothetical protein [Caudoviricetes sp.]
MTCLECIVVTATCSRHRSCRSQLHAVHVLDDCMRSYHNQSLGHFVLLQTLYTSFDEPEAVVILREEFLRTSVETRELSNKGCSEFPHCVVGKEQTLLENLYVERKTNDNQLLLGSSLILSVNSTPLTVNVDVGLNSVVVCQIASHHLEKRVQTLGVGSIILLLNHLLGLVFNIQLVEDNVVLCLKLLRFLKSQTSFVFVIRLCKCKEFLYLFDYLLHLLVAHVLNSHSCKCFLVIHCCYPLHKDRKINLINKIFGMKIYSPAENILKDCSERTSSTAQFRLCKSFRSSSTSLRYLWN